MYFRQFYLGCLAHASYLIGAEGRAAVVDPQRDVDQYIDAARENGLEIEYVIETHLHADFVSGHRELADRTGARIVFGENAGATFDYLSAKDGDRFDLGPLRLTVLATPGHTPEGISILAEDTSEPTTPARVFTGDTLFIGDVGRPDLIGSKGYTAEQMAGMLFDSLHDKLLPLPDEVEVYPAHGAGSLCGRNMSRETMSTMGEQRKLNHALQPMARDAFIAIMTTDLPDVPAYFATDAEINRTGASALGELAESVPLEPAVVRTLQQAGHLVLDVRPAGAFGTGHVPGSLSIGLGGQFASWAGSLIRAGTPIVVVAEDESGAGEAVTRLARVGVESVKGYLDGGIYAWDRAGLPVATLAQMPVDELKARMDEGARLQVIDVRRAPEFWAGHVPTSKHVQLGDLEAERDRLDRSRPTVVICGSGYRSSAGASLLERGGFADLYNVVGGTAAWVNAGYPTDRETP
jgi:hydroxyacylglutathione hydrolase